MLLSELARGGPGLALGIFSYLFPLVHLMFELRRFEARQAAQALAGESKGS